ncbi:hypothetical protein G6F18_010523 [Rhizopus arrhizus]|nr:hypothetical protein G6F20_009024 [Rhizopus arrhizus]KAG0825172.1 hypothetical protein G6F18_010523 [Rhizopus arrhizus]KAG0911200.1 hypothetical protein G6F33_007199 [Rhizopus arrhizus]
MQNKQAKLKEQEKELGNQSSQEQLQIFKGLSIHINGYTQPSIAELRRMILQHGGDFQHYLKKLTVTHILASNLTNAKMQEFRSYKVVRPDWITESVKAKQLLPWQNYRLVYNSSNQAELSFKDNNSNKKWEKQVSTANPDFMKRYYETSRLHYLSTWKAELKEIVRCLELNCKDNPEINARKRKEKPFRVIMHVDFDCFFASVGILNRPYLKDKPVAVSHSKGFNETSYSDIASCNYIARSFGVYNGMTIKAAKSLCPILQIIPYEFEKYKLISEKFYKILFKYADEIEAVSVDEALMDVSSHINDLYEGEEEALALKIRNEIQIATACDASIGIGPNILLARMSTKRAKPSNQFYCKPQDIEDLLSTQRIIDLPGVGYAITEKLASLNVEAISDIRNIPLHELKSKIGQKMGQTLYNYSRGIDNRPLAVHQQRQSVSSEVNWGVRFESEENEKIFVYDLCKEVSNRLKKYNKRGKTITILRRKEGAEEPKKHLAHGQVDSFSKSYTLNEYTDYVDTINKHVYSMLKSFRFHYKDIRGLGIQITKLDNQETVDENQGNLSYKTFNESNITKLTKKPRLEATRAPKKQDMSVDPDVYSELPESVKKELLSGYNLVFHKEQTAIPEVHYDTQLPELPPWSQLDPNSLLALPDTMREQVLKAYSDKRNEPKQDHKPLIVEPKITKKNHSNNDATLTQLFQPWRNISTINKFEGEPVDVNVWNKLPLSACNDLLVDDKRTTEKIIVQHEMISRKDKIPKPSVELPNMPSLQGLTDISDIRKLLREWVSAFEDKPEPEDVKRITRYLVDLVKYSNLEKVQLVIKYLEYITAQNNNEWKMQVTSIKQALDHETIQLYQFPLK